MSGSPDSDLAERIDALSDLELRHFEARNTASRALADRARGSLAGGIASAFQRANPWPIHFASARGALVTDVDGNSRIDFNNAYGAGIHGYGHPAIATAVSRRYAAGSQFGAPSEEAILVADELAGRWGLTRWRFASSGREAAGDALRIARSSSGRKSMIRMGGGYHGVGVAEGPDVKEVPFNDAAALERALADLDRDGRPAAGVILEPAFALGTLLPAAGYLKRVRALTHAAGALLIFDEAKTGLTLAPGGGSERYGVRPDLVVVAKALGGGIPAAAIGGTERAMAPVESGAVLQAGTFNGNPLAMAAARASLTEVLTSAAYERFERHAERLASELAAPLAAAPLDACAFAVAARGAVVLAPRPPSDAVEHAAARRPALERLLWLYAANRGIYLAPARPLCWTLSVAHDSDHVEEFVRVLSDLFRALCP